MYKIPKTVAIPLLSILVLVLIIMWLAGAFDSKIKPGELSSSSTYSGETLLLKNTLVAFHEAIPATVQSKQSSNIASRILAPIKSIHVKSGDRVNQGDLLIELDNRNSQAAVAQSRENMRAIQARIVQAKSHFNRTKNLYIKQSATKADFEQASSHYSSLKAQLAASKQQLHSAETTLSYSRVLAPFSARVINRLAEPGDLASPGMTLLTLYDPDSLRIDTHVRESLALSLSVGQVLEADISAIKQTIRVTIEEIVPAADPGSRSFLIKTKAEHQSQLLPGMFAKIRIPTGEQERLLVPESYIKQVGQLDVVWVVENTRPVRRFIRRGQRFNEDVEIVSGLWAGEKLVRPSEVETKL